jgi:mycothiol synthase
MPPPDVRTTHGELPALCVTDVRDLAARAEQTDGVAPLSEQPLLWLTDTRPGVVHLSLAATTGLAAYAQLDLRDPAQAAAELVVAPEARRAGLGTAMLRAVHAAAHEAGAEHVSVWAHGALPPARALAQRLGLRIGRELWQMRLDGLTAPSSLPPLPPGVTVRTFEPGRDEDAWLAVNARAFAHHPEQGRLTRADLDAREAEPWFDAFGWTKVPGPSDQQDTRGQGDAVDTGGPGTAGEIYALGVDPSEQGTGLGRALTARMLDHLARRGRSAAVLYTEGDNVAAVRTYRSAGFVRSAIDIAYALDVRSSVGHAPAICG